MRNYNKYDFLVILTLATLAWGNNEAFRFLYPIRLIGFAGLFITAMNWKLISGQYRKWIPLFLIWGLYTIFSVVWTPDTGEGVIQAFHIITMFGAIGLMMVSSIKAKNPLSSIVLGWAAMVLITLPIAFWELRTGNHLSSGAYNADSMSYGQLRVFAAVTFGNLNGYAVVLASALPFILTGWIGDKKETPFRIVLIVLTVLMAGILLLNASRGCLLCLIIGLLFMLMMQMKGKFSIMRVALIIGVFAFAVYYAVEKLQMDMFFEITARMENEGMESGRLDIYKAGLEAASHSAFLGGGVGCTVPYMKAFTTCSIKVTHNAYLEILIEYGILIFLFFWTKFYTSALSLWKSDNIKVKLIGSYFVVATVILFSVDDYYTGESVIWLFAASLIVLSNLYGKKRQRRKTPTQTKPLSK